MKAATFSALKYNDSWDILICNLETNFCIDPRDDWLCNYIHEKANHRYKDWKSACKKFWLANPDGGTPMEFLGRPEQWEWLVNHFKDPANEAVGIQRRAARLVPGRVNHHSGRVTYGRRADNFAKSGSSAPLIDAYNEVYSKDPIGAENAAKMKELVSERLVPNDEDSVNNALEPEEQIEIIKHVIPQKRGTLITGVGSTRRRPPLPRGGSQPKETNSQLLSRVSTLEDRIQFLENQVLRGATQDSVQSDGATHQGS